MRDDYYNSLPILGLLKICMVLLCVYFSKVLSVFHVVSVNIAPPTTQGIYNRVMGFTSHVVLIRTATNMY